MVARAALALALAWSLTACGTSETNPWLEALQRERLAHLVPAHGKIELDLQSTTLGNTEDPLSTPTSAVVSRSFSYRTRAAALRARQIALAAAAESGWRLNRYRANAAGPFRGWKHLPPGEATLSVAEWKKGGRYHVSIRLEPAR